MGRRQDRGRRGNGRGRRVSALCAALALSPVIAWGEDRPCGKADFEAVVEEAANSLRELNTKNKPAFQEKLRELKEKRGWTHDQFMREAAPFVRDDKIADFDQRTDELLGAISSMGEEGASANNPDCALMLELRARMTVLVATQTAKWGYMFDKINTEMKK